MARFTETAPFESRMPPFDGATGWLNSAPLTPTGLRGKVVLVEFGTYTCINWLRTLPFVRDWTAKYGEYGFETVIVHTPEFEFEHDMANVRRALADRKIEFPIAVDNDFAVWSAFSNNYWPALYFVDAEGRIRHHHFGEGGYRQSESVIQELLAEAGAKGAPGGFVSGVVSGAGIEVAADWDNLQSPETYLGYGQAQNFVSRRGLVRDETHAYTRSAKLQLNQWDLGGEWKVGVYSADLEGSSGQIAFRFHARDVNLVMGPSVPSKAVKARVLLDGQPPGVDHGIDADEQGNVEVGQQRLYQLVRQHGSVVDREVQIQFQDSDVQAFVFTFG